MVVDALSLLHALAQLGRDTERVEPVHQVRPRHSCLEAGESRVEGGAAPADPVALAHAGIEAGADLTQPVVQRPRLGGRDGAPVAPLRLHCVLHVRTPGLAQAGEVDAFRARLARQAERHPHAVCHGANEDRERQTGTDEDAGGGAGPREQQCRRSGDGLRRLAVLEVLRQAVDDAHAR